MRISRSLAVLGIVLLAAGCGSTSPGRVAQRLATPTLETGHIVRVPMGPAKKATAFPTLAPGVPTPVLPTVVARTPKPYVWPASAYRAHITGTITDARTHAPVPGARVAVARGQRVAVSNGNGHYSIAFPVGGMITVEVSKRGYIAQPGVGMLSTGQTTHVNFSLQPLAHSGKGPPSFPVIIGKPQ